MSDPRYQQLNQQWQGNLQQNGLGMPTNFAPAGSGAPAGGGGAPAGGGGAPGNSGEAKKERGDSKPAAVDTLYAHRLRAMPFLGRNMGMVTSMLNVVIGVTILANYPYRDGITAVQMSTFKPATGGLAPNTITLSSSYGYPIAFVCLVGGLGMLYFEKSTWGVEDEKEAKVDVKFAC